MERPPGAIGGAGDYRFERSVVHREIDETEKPRYIDLYRRSCFVLEAKQGANPRQPSLFGIGPTEGRANIRRSAGWTQAMMKARGQAEGYARDLPANPAGPAEIAARFAKAPRHRMKEMLEALVAMGQARHAAGGRYVT